MKNENNILKISFQDLHLFPQLCVNFNSFILYTKVSKELEVNLWNYYLGLLPQNLHNEVVKYYRWQDRQNSLFGKLLVFVGYYMVQNEKLDYSKYLRDSYGKPHIKNADFEFNISHSGDMVVCAFSKEKIGIDIEEIKEVDIEDFYSVFTSAEIDVIKKNGELKFYELWTAKEAIVKAIGKGLSIPISNIEVMDNYVTYKDMKWYKERITYDEYYCTKVSQIKNQKSKIIEVIF